MFLFLFGTQRVYYHFSWKSDGHAPNGRRAAKPPSSHFLLHSMVEAQDQKAWQEEVDHVKAQLLEAGLGSSSDEEDSSDSSMARLAKVVDP